MSPMFVAVLPEIKDKDNVFMFVTEFKKQNPNSPTSPYTN